MNKPLKITNKAANLKALLIVATIILAGLICFGFYTAQVKLASMADEVKLINGQIASAVGSPDENEQMQNDLASHKAEADQAEALIISGQDYKNAVIQMLDQYSSKTGIAVADYKFFDTNPSGASSLITGVTPKYVTISLNSPVIYENFVQFLKLIETSTPKMQVTGITINRASADSVSVEPITIEVYTK